ncbi:MAG: hypothetical protein ABIG84_01505 [archaeon]
MEISDGMKKRKGQWLLITSLILIISISTIILMTAESKDITETSYSNKELFGNIEKESQSAINVILSENHTSEHLTSNLKIYIEFLRQYANEHNSKLSGFYIIGMPYNSDLNITIANFLGVPMKNLNISVENNQLQNLHMDDRNFTTFHFAPVGNDIIFNYNFTYTDSSNEMKTMNHTLSTKKRVFSILDLNMESPGETWKNYQIN